MSEGGTITTPWTDEQVAGLNAWQASGYVHPFTCGSGNRRDRKHTAWRAKNGGDYGQLIATPDGWRCPACDYRQDWAHDFMANGAPPDPFAPFRSAGGVAAPGEYPTPAPKENT